MNSFARLIRPALLGVVRILVCVTAAVAFLALARPLEEMISPNESWRAGMYGDLYFKPHPLDAAARALNLIGSGFVAGLLLAVLRSSWTVAIIVAISISTFGFAIGQMDYWQHTLNRSWWIYFAPLFGLAWPWVTYRRLKIQ